MMDELNLQQAKFLLQYVRANKDAGTNVEVLCGLALTTIEMYLAMLVQKMEGRRS
jgi:hypothetical protein